MGSKLANLISQIDDFVSGHPGRKIRVVRGLEDGHYVFVHTHQMIDLGATQWVTMNFSLTGDDDRVVDRWDVVGAYAGSTPSGHTSVDGPTEVTDLDRTDANKALVHEFIRTVLMEGGDPARVDDYISHEQYVQHNGEVSDGLEPFRALVLAEDKPLVYEAIVLMVGQGNFVATYCTAMWEGRLYLQADLFRIEEGKIVEHWDAAEAVSARSVRGGAG